MDIIAKIRVFFEKNSWAGYILIAIFCAIFFSFLEWGNGLADPDSFYHIKITELIAESGIVRDFPWLVFTPLEQIFTDHHLLYHFFLLPFVKISPFIGAKIATVIINTAFFVLFFHFLRIIKARRPLFFVFLLLSSAPFIFRISLVKAIGFSLVFLFLIFIFIYKKKYFYAGVVSFFYVWAYGGWPISIFVAGVYFFASILTNVIIRNEIVERSELFMRLPRSLRSLAMTIGLAEWKPLVATVTGSLCGVVLNPYFPQNIKFYWTQIVEIALVNYSSKVGVGSEWYGFGAGEVLLWAMPVILIFFFGFLFFLCAAVKRATAPDYEKIRDAFFFIILSGVFFVAMFRARRNSEYFFPFFVLASAVLWRDYYSKEIYSFLKKRFVAVLKSEMAYRIFLGYLALMLAASFVVGVWKNKKYFNTGFSYDAHKEAAETLKQNTKARDIVFTSDWDDWPMLFYYNDNNRYLVGLDATFMYKYSPELYKEWREIAEGRHGGDIYEAIKTDFRASAVFIAEQDIQKMDAGFKNDERFEIIYSGGDKVYKLR